MKPLCKPSSQSRRITNLALWPLVLPANHFHKRVSLIHRTPEALEQSASIRALQAAVDKDIG